MRTQNPDLITHSASLTPSHMFLTFPCWLMRNEFSSYYLPQMERDWRNGGGGGGGGGVGGWVGGEGL